MPQEQPLPLPTCKANTHHLRPVVAAYTAPRPCQALADSLPRLAEILATALPRSWQRQGLAEGLARACQTTERRLERPAPTLAPCPHEAPACVRAEGIFLANGRGGTDNIQCVNSQPRTLRRLPSVCATFQPIRARVGCAILAPRASAQPRKLAPLRVAQDGGTVHPARHPQAPPIPTPTQAPPVKPSLHSSPRPQQGPAALDWPRTRPPASPRVHHRPALPYAAASTAPAPARSSSARRAAHNPTARTTCPTGHGPGAPRSRRSA